MSKAKKAVEYVCFAMDIFGDSDETITSPVSLVHREHDVPQILG
jgi:hypothetical protein